MLGARSPRRTHALSRLAAVAGLSAIAMAVAVPAASASAPQEVATAAQRSSAAVSAARTVMASHSATPTQKRTALGGGVLAEASRFRGTPYVYGASGPGAFDCSGFTSFVFRQLGVSLPHSSFGQYAMTHHIPRGAAVPGDLIFLNGLGHVAIYAGHGMMWDAPSPGGRVSERRIYSSSYLVGRVRI